MYNNIAMVQLTPKLSISISEDARKACYCNFTEAQVLRFTSIICNGLSFPQIIAFVFSVIAIFYGETSFIDLLLCNLIASVGFTLIWYLIKLYKLPGINFLCSFINSILFHFFIHTVIVAVIALFVVHKWQIIIFYIAGRIAAKIANNILFAVLSNVKYNDNVAAYVSGFRVR